MKVGNFDLSEPLPELREPYALANLRPWVDVGSVGTLTLNYLEQLLGAKPLGHLSRPGRFFDYTRYRPTIFTQEGLRRVAIPNTIVNYSQRPEGNDFLSLHLLEPHIFGEDYVNSVLALLEKLGVTRYCLVGSMYDLVPHTRPLRVTGSAVGEDTEKALRQVKVNSSTYQGPTTILALISQEAPKLQLETISLVVHLPQYTQLEEDYNGLLCLLRILGTIYGLTLDLQSVEHKASQQYAEISREVERNAQVKEMVSQLEKFYEYRLEQETQEKPSQLSPEVEKFLRDINKHFGTN